MRTWRRRMFRWTLVLLLLVAVLAAVFVLPRLGAIRTLQAFQGEPPQEGAVPEGMRLVEDPARFGFNRVWTAGDPEDPQLLFVHGVAERGIVDGRIVQAVDAFRQGGFFVVAPEVPLLVHPPYGDRDLERLHVLLETLRDPERAPGDPDHVGAMGISVGGALVLRAVLAAPDGVDAVLLLGTPENLRRVGTTWFSLPSLPATEEGEAVASMSDAASLDPLERARRHEAAFARNMVQRAALPALVEHAGDRSLLRAWLASRWEPTAELALESAAARTFADRVRSPDSHRSGHGPYFIEAGWPVLRLFSVPEAADALEPLRGKPCFLLYGAGDPLVPTTEMDRLADRLVPVTACHALASSILGHVNVQEADLAETWRHVTFMDDFFDAIRK